MRKPATYSFTVELLLTSEKKKKKSLKAIKDILSPIEVNSA